MNEEEKDVCTYCGKSIRQCNFKRHVAVCAKRPDPETLSEMHRKTPDSRRLASKLNVSPAAVQRWLREDGAGKNMAESRKRARKIYQMISLFPGVRKGDLALLCDMSAGHLESMLPGLDRAGLLLSEDNGRLFLAFPPGEVG